MPPDLFHKLCNQFAMGSALGTLLAAALFASDAHISRLILQSPDPHLALAVVVSGLVAFCGIGATLSGFVFIVTEER